MPGDIPDVLRHMRSLAEFEHYISDFTVDEKSLLTRAFGPHPECHIFVAECREGIIGYAVGLVTYINALNASASALASIEARRCGAAAR